jgi:hypothetical protein
LSENKADGKSTEPGADEKKRPLNDVWAYDTLTNKWFEIKAGFRTQKNGKKSEREFLPRMAHSAVQLD